MAVSFIQQAGSIEQLKGEHFMIIEEYFLSFLQEKTQVNEVVRGFKRAQQCANKYQ